MLTSQINNPSLFIIAITISYIMCGSVFLIGVCALWFQMIRAIVKIFHTFYTAFCPIIAVFFSCVVCTIYALVYFGIAGGTAAIAYKLIGSSFGLNLR
jgi:hypothetical protein